LTSVTWLVQACQFLLELLIQQFVPMMAKKHKQFRSPYPYHDLLLLFGEFHRGRPKRCLHVCSLSAFSRVPFYDRGTFQTKDRTAWRRLRERLWIGRQIEQAFKELDATRYLRRKFAQDRWAFLNRQFDQGYPLVLTPVGEQAPTGGARVFDPSGFQAGQDVPLAVHP
jgi:hypothetical protein